MAPVEDNDSGMESQEGSQAQDGPTSKDYSPEKKQLELEMDYDEEVNPLNIATSQRHSCYETPHSCT